MIFFIYIRMLPWLHACLAYTSACLLSSNYFLNYIIYAVPFFPYVVARHNFPICYLLFCMNHSASCVIILSSTLYKRIPIPYVLKAWSSATNAIDLEMCLDFSFLFSFVAFLQMNVYYVCSVLSPLFVSMPAYFPSSHPQMLAELLPNQSLDCFVQFYKILMYSRSLLF